jgi:hypothetical protein
MRIWSNQNSFKKYFKYNSNTIQFTNLRYMKCNQSVPPLAHFFKWLNIKLLYELTIPLGDICPRKMMSPQKILYMNVHRNTIHNR